jgi:predicted DNA binding CopG/RHH family protein
MGTFMNKINSEKITKKQLANSYRVAHKSITPIDEEEVNMLESWKNTRDNDVSFDDKTLKKVLEAQREYKMNYKKNTTITMRINSDMKEKIKLAANEVGLSYQSFLNMVIYRIAEGKLKIDAKFI